MKKLFLLAPLALTGCIGTMVPMTTIKGSLAGQPFSIAVPKDIVMEGLTAEALQSGVVTVKISKLSATMNPAVITTTGDAQAKLIQTAVAAGGDAVGKAVGAAK